MYDISDTDAVGIRAALLAHQNYIGLGPFERFDAQMPKPDVEATCCFDGQPCTIGCVKPDGEMCASAKVAA